MITNRRVGCVAWRVPIRAKRCRELFDIGGFESPHSRLSEIGDLKCDEYSRMTDARIRDKSVKVYVGTFATQRDAEAADEEHRVTQCGIKGRAS